MLEKDLIKRIAKDSGYTQKIVREVVQSFKDVACELLTSEDEVILNGFGSLYIRNRAPHRYMNPNTGEIEMLPPFKHCTFKAYRSLKETVNGRN